MMYNDQNDFIHGSLSDGSANSLIYTPVTITINGENFYVKTDEYGTYELLYTPNKIGLNNITVTYPGNTKYYKTMTTQTFYVKPMDTLIELMDFYDAEIYGYPIINGDFMDKNGNPLTYTTLNLNINGKTYKTKTDGVGHFSYDYYGEIYDLGVVTVSYPGNEKYTGASITTGSEYFDPELTVYIEPTTWKEEEYNFNKTVTIKGKIRDFYRDFNLTNVPIIITLNEKSYTVYSDNYGDFKYSFIAREVGINNLTITYKGDNRYYHQSIYKTTFAVSKNPVDIAVINTVQSSDGQYIKIQGRIFDYKGNMLKNVPVTLKIDDKIYKAQTDKDGIYTCNYKNNSTSLHFLSVISEETSGYAQGQTDITFIPQREGEIEIILIKYSGEGYSQFYEDVNATKYIGNDIIQGWYQYYDGEFDPGLYVDIQGRNYASSLSSNMINSVIFYYKNDETGEILKTVGTINKYKTRASASNIDGYTPYKAVMKYSVRPSQEITNDLST